jgi:hypothetical protein
LTPCGRREIHKVVFVRKPKVTRPFGKPRRRREGNIKIYLKAIGWRGFIKPRIGTMAGFCEHGYDPSGYTQCPARRGTWLGEGQWRGRSVQAVAKGTL